MSGGRGRKPCRYFSGQEFADDDFEGGESFERTHGKASQNRYRSDGGRNFPRGESSSFGNGGRVRGRGGRGRGRGHPPGLKGKEIGLYYQRLNSESGNKGAKRTAHDTGFQNTLEIDLREDHQMEITDILEKLKYSYDRKSGHGQSSNSFMDTYRENIRDNNLTDLKHEVSENSCALIRNPGLDDILIQEMQEKSGNDHFNRMQIFRKKLPAYQTKTDILNMIDNHQVVVISGETGCGKTTQIPQYVLDDCIAKRDGSLCNILCSQPRRISATSVAERIADERGERVGGNSVGYSIRLESRLPNRSGGTITLCTVGVIFQYLKSDPMLSKVSHVVVDEVHERDVLSDFLLTILKDLIKKRPELKVIVMSATLNSDKFSSYFNDCPMFNIPGMTFPVDEYYLEDVLEITRFRYPDDPPEQDRVGRNWKKWADDKKKKGTFAQFIRFHILKLEREGKYSASTRNELQKQASEEISVDLIQCLLEHICDTDKDNGAVLIFVPGWDEISKIHKQLESSGRFPSYAFKIIPLHSQMPTVNQRDVFNRPPNGLRKIVISTNIAETSVTIDDIIYIIDTGKIKITNYDLQKNLETLDTEWVSHANAKQRKGRAGRVQKGICYHLFSRARLASLEEFKKPEVLRKRLEETVLQIKLLKLGKGQRFLNLLPDPPSTTAVKLAITRLNQLHALDSEENLTPLGFHLAQLPMDPQTGKMILMGAMFLCVDPIFSIAASLSFKDPFYIPLGKEKHVDRIRRDMSGDSKSDHIAIVRAMEGYDRALARNDVSNYCYHNFLSQNSLKMLHSLKIQFAQYLHEMKFLPSSDVKQPSMNLNSENIALIKSISCSGMYPNVAYVTAKSRHKGFPIVRTEEDGRVNIHPKSVNANVCNFESPFLIYHEKMKTKAVNLYDTTMVSAFPLVFFGGKIDFLWSQQAGSLGVDGLMRFKCSERVYNLIEGLRNELDAVFDHKICNPGPTNWSVSSTEGALLRTVSKVITSEYRYLMSEIDISSDDSDSD